MNDSEGGVEQTSPTGRGESGGGSRTNGATFTIIGGSDDLVYPSGIPGCDEFNVFAEGKYIGSFQVWSPSLKIGVRVHCIYDGYWSFAVGMLDEESEHPDWPVRVVRHDRPKYSMRLEIDCPADVELIPEHPFDERDDE